MAVMFLMVNIALFFNNYVNPVAMDAISWKYYIVYVCWLAFEFGFVYFFFVETRYTPLEEIAKYFDGEDAQVSTLAQGDDSGIAEKLQAVASEKEHIEA